MNKDPKDGLDGYDDAEASGEAAAARDEDLEAKEGEEEEEDSFLPVGLASCRSRGRKFDNRAERACSNAELEL